MLRISNFLLIEGPGSGANVTCGMPDSAIWIMLNILILVQLKSDIRAHDMLVLRAIKLNHEPPPPPTITTPQPQHLTMSDRTASLTAHQIRRRANDYDGQIRLGLEEGNVRQVVKRLGKDLVSPIFIFFAYFH